MKVRFTTMNSVRVATESCGGRQDEELHKGIRQTCG